MRTQINTNDGREGVDKRVGGALYGGRYSQRYLHVVQIGICMWYKLMNMYHPLQHHEYKCFSDIILEIRNCKYQHKKCLVHEYHTKHGDYLKMK